MAETPGPLTVLIADDDELIRKVIAIYFGGKGYRVIAVASGQECLAQMRLSEPDAVLLDVTMPAMDGWEVCRRITGVLGCPGYHVDGPRPGKRQGDGGCGRGERVCDQARFAEGVGGQEFAHW